MGNRPAFNNLMKEIKTGKFLFTGELEPTKMVDISEIIHSAEAMKEYVVAANVTDGDSPIHAKIAYRVHETGL